MQLPVFRDGRLRLGAGAEITVDSPQWRDWLAAATGFVVEHPAGTFTVRREASGNRRGSGYWRAYRRVHGQRRRIYLGTTDQLTAEAISIAAAALLGLGTPGTSGGHAIGTNRAAADPDQPLTTKIRIPQPRYRALPRPQLAAWLAEANRQPVTVLSAPAGFGKTTTLASWAADRGAAWLSLDRDDNEPARFCQHLAAALRIVLPAHDPAVPPPPRRRVAGLVNALAARVDQTLLVLDDYHEIDSPAVHELLVYLAEHLPPQVRLVLATRHLPPLPLARWRAQHRLAELSATHLRLTAAEAVGFLTEVMEVPVTAATAAALHTRTEGWVAGLQLVGLALRRGVPAERAVSGARPDLDAYLVTEVLDRLPLPVREFVLHTSILDRLSGPLCDALTGGTGGGGGMLRALVDGDLFVVPLDGDGIWYRYHHLFSAAVRTRLQHQYPSLLPILHQRAAAWHERYGDPGRAVEHMLAAGAAEQAGAIVARLAEQDGGLWGQEARLRRWLAALPEPVLARHPVLCLLVYWVATRQSAVAEHPPLAALAGDPQPWLERADAAQLPGPLRGIRLALVTYRQFLDGPVQAAADTARTALDLLPAAQTGLRAETALRLIDPLYHGCPAEPAARAEQEFTTLSRPPHHVERRLDALLGLAMVLLLRGDLARVEAACDRGDRLAANPLVGVDEAAAHRQFALTFRLVLLREQNRIADAESLLASAGPAAMAHPDPGVRIHIHWSTADLHAIRQDAAAALAALDEADEFIAGLPAFAWPGIGAVARRTAAVRRAAVLLALGHLVDAQSCLDRARGIESAGELPPGLALYEAAVTARLTLAEPDPAAAARLATDAAGRFRDVVGAACQIRLRVVTALARQATGDPEAALAALADSLALAVPGRFIRPFLEPPGSLAGLLSELARRDRVGGLAVPHRHLTQVLRSCRAPDVQPANAALTRREREVLGLLADGHSAPQIARRLGVAPATVRSHLDRLHAKLGARTQAQAVAQAYRRGLLPA